MNVTDELTPRPRPGVIGTPVDDGAVVVLPDAGEVKVLNELGGVIWQLADGTRTVGQIIAEISATYEVAPAQVAADTRSFVGQLAAMGVLEI